MVQWIMGLVSMTLMAGISFADCRDDQFKDECGLEFFVSVEKAVLAPRDRVVFRIEMINAGAGSILIPERFFKNVLPCAVLPSGKVDDFKALFAAPECEAPPSEGDVLLGAGESIEFEKANYAHPEKGLQKWSFEGILWECPDIPHSINCEIESNTVLLLVLD